MCGIIKGITDVGAYLVGRISSNLKVLRKLLEERA